MQNLPGKTEDIQLQFLSELQTPTQCNYTCRHLPCRRCTHLVSSHCHSIGSLAEDIGNSALLLSNTIPFHTKCTSGRTGLFAWTWNLLYKSYSNLNLTAQVSMYNGLSRSRGSEKGNSAHSGLLFLWRKYLCSSRFLPEHRVWIPDFMGAIRCLASPPLNSREVGLYFSSSNSRKLQGCSEICFPCEFPSILCFHTDTKIHLPSRTKETATRSWSGTYN